MNVNVLYHLVKNRVGIVLFPLNSHENEKTVVVTDEQTNLTKLSLLFQRINLNHFHTPLPSMVVQTFRDLIGKFSKM